MESFLFNFLMLHILMQLNIMLDFLVLIFVSRKFPNMLLHINFLINLLF